jgi:flagellin-like protein
MENINDTTIFDLTIDDEGKSHFSAIAQWANIGAIVGFAGIGIAIISFGISIYKIGGNAVSGILGSLITLAITFLLNITLFNAAKNIKSGVELTEQGHFTLGLVKLAGYFKIVGILTIIVMVVAFFAVLAFSLLGASTSRGF